MDFLVIELDSTNASNITEPDPATLQAFPEPYKTLLAVLYGTTASIALLANILAIFILITKKRSSADLRKYLVNLAIADISMAAFSIPFTYSDFMYADWKFPHIMCPLTHFITICSVCVSIFTLTAIGIERLESLQIFILFIENIYEPDVSKNKLELVLVFKISYLLTLLTMKVNLEEVL